MRILNLVSSGKSRRVTSVIAALLTASVGLVLSASPASAETIKGFCYTQRVGILVALEGQDFGSEEAFLENVVVEFHSGVSGRNNNEVKWVVRFPNGDPIAYGNLEDQEGGGKTHKYIVNRHAPSGSELRVDVKADQPGDDEWCAVFIKVP